MSYEVYLEMDAGGPEPIEAGWWNYTSNCARMWRAAGCDIAEFDGRKAGELSQSLTVAIREMEQNREGYEAMNPPNGWGSVDTLLPALSELRSICDAAPLAVVRVSR